MADYYTQFSFVALETEEQRAWATAVAAHLDRYRYDELPERGANPEWNAVLPDDDYLGFVAEVDADGLWIYAEDSGTPENVVPLVQEFLRRFHPDGHVGFEWANTCSKMRLDSFGGGACFITATDVKWMASSTWLAQRYHEHGRVCRRCKGPVVIETSADGSPEWVHDGTSWPHADEVHDFRFCHGEDAVDENFLAGIEDTEPANG